MANCLATTGSGWGSPDLRIEVHSVLETAEKGTGHEYSGVSGPSSFAPFPWGWGVQRRPLSQCWTGER